MKQIITLFLCLFSIYCFAQTPDFKMIGFATLNGGTTGGEQGLTVTPTTFAELKQYVEDAATPYVIRIEKEFTTGVPTYVDAEGSIVAETASGAIATTFGAVLRIGSNKTLIGIGDQAFFNRIGLVIQCQSNIIIRNIKFTMKNVPATRDGEYKILSADGVTTVGDPDCIGIQADAESIPEVQRISKHIWIDHCEFFNENIANKDRYDGLIDNKNNVQNMTISWCYFHDHSKALLSGKGNSDLYNRTITYHHNYFSNINGSRLPLLRFGQHHYFNNFMESCDGDGVNLRINTNCYIERNYYKDSKKPIFGKLSENGQAKLVDNIFENCARLHAGLSNINGVKSEVLSSSEEFIDACNFTPSELYSYTDIMSEVADVPQIVKTYSGVGKIQENSTGNSAVSINNYLILKESNGIRIYASAGETLSVFGIDGKQILAKKITNENTFVPLYSKGVVIVKITRNKEPFCKKMIL
jgi:pectate lyase